MVLQENAIFQFIRTTYGSFSSEDLMDDLVGLLTSTAPGTALLDRLNARINKHQRYKKHAKDANRQVYTPTEAVRLVLELEMPKERWCFLLCRFFALLMHCATTPCGVQVTSCTPSKPYHSHTSSNVVFNSIWDTYIL